MFGGLLKPDDWFVCSINDTHCSTKGLGRIEGENGIFCSSGCLSSFVGSYFTAVKIKYENRLKCLE